MLRSTPPTQPPVLVPRPSRRISSAAAAAESPTMASPIRKVPQGNNLWEEIGGQACHSLTRVSTRELRENQVRRPLNSSAQPRAPAARVDAERPHPRIQPSGRPEAPQEVRSGQASSTEPAKLDGTCRARAAAAKMKEAGDIGLAELKCALDRYESHGVLWANTVPMVG